MKLGYILSENNIKLDNFITINSLPSDNDLPVLIVGREFSKKLNVKTSILKKKIDSNTFWTYSSKEKKSEYTDDIEFFKNFCITKFLNGIKYYYIDPFSMNMSSMKRMVSKIKELKSGLIYDNKDMGYILFNDTIFGLHWKTLEYVGISKEKIFKYLKNNNFNVLPKDEIFNICIDETKKLNNIKVLPYLYKLRVYDGQNIVGNFYQ